MTIAMMITLSALVVMSAVHSAALRAQRRKTQPMTQIENVPLRIHRPGFL